MYHKTTFTDRESAKSDVYRSVELQNTFRPLSVEWNQYSLHSLIEFRCAKSAIHITALTMIKRNGKAKKWQLYNGLVKGSISLPHARLDKPDQSTVQIQHKCNHRMFGSDTLSAGFLWPDVAIMHPWTPSDKRKPLPFITSSFHANKLCNVYHPHWHIPETSRICQGNPDHWFIPLQKERQRIFKVHLAAAL